MWEAIQKLWEVIQVPDNRDTLTWVGGGIAAVCGGIATVATGVWAVVKFRAKLKKAAEKKGGDTNITQSGQGLALGDKAIFNAPVTIAPNSGPSPEHIEKIQKPWADELAAQRIQFAALQSEYVALTKMLLEKIRRLGRARSRQSARRSDQLRKARPRATAVCNKRSTS
jgi:hypothetical protein